MLHACQQPGIAAMKKAYVIAEVKVLNQEPYEAYRSLTTDTVARHGGQFIVRGGKRDQREGGDEQHNDMWRTVIIEFPSLAAAQGWYDSVEYTKAKEIRLANSIGRLCIVEGT
jgi:uncharacterized protein (DUF1330 family)